MRSLVTTVLLCGALFCHAVGKDGGEKPAAKAAEAKAEKEAPLKLLNAKELDQLLKRRVRGGLGYTFTQFANMFMVTSNLGTGKCVGLQSRDKDILATELQGVFPDSYHPTLAELLDAIALQTFSKWSYIEKDQTIMTDEKDEAKPHDGVVVITFSRLSPAGPRKKPFEVTPAKGWKHEDRGNWETYIPPIAPVGMDIYEMGRYSARKGDTLAGLMTGIRKDVSLEWARRINPQAGESDLKPAKVGDIEALHFEAPVPSKMGPKLHWRQWVFTVGDRCYFVVSTLFAEQEVELLPDVEQMLKTFKSLEVQ